METSGWAKEPDSRGTFSLVLSCVLTLTLCVWSALHLNVPPAGHTFRSRALVKAKWIVYGIFAPELVVATAAAQYISARWLKVEIEKDAQLRSGSPHLLPDGTECTSHTWNMTQCFYAAMGGIIATIPVGDDQMETLRVTLTVEAVRLLSFYGRLPPVLNSQVQDKSKADWLTKSIVCVQASWMIAQVIGRLADHLPVSLLEINTCGHVLCAFILFCLWWHKPLDVEAPVVLESDPSLDETLALMYMCSALSADDAITDFRCLIYVAPAEQSDARSATSPAGERTMSRDVSLAPLMTELSIGSAGSRNPGRFLGSLNDLRPGLSRPPSGGRSPGRRAMTALEYSIDENSTAIAPEHRVFFEPPYIGLSLRHGDLYCRRAFSDAKVESAHVPVSLPYLERASRAADRLWKQCKARPDYKIYYFTTSTLGTYLGETEYMVLHVLNFPSMSNLGLGQVDLHRDALRSVFAFSAAAYGGLHASAWNEFFPSTVERLFWICASLTMASSGALLWAFWMARQTWPEFDRFVSGITPGVVIGNRKEQKPWVTFAKRWALYLILGLLAVARVFIVIEAFVSLREVPKAIYDTPEWTDYLPHL
ncbi:hypothetical protein P152DRAFT_469152 [Eremomyces bilateralis CBS 781.70]|uniref:Uncharacterized protein n=1 Tax=Eremomyces bilateralis CBS 781.70 TaxID=1392243 RepID=A0A6G1FR03_9PEZI|nr:uncharacterized protein P152DRAFT_469152 [Eremomyces bilateralis CBS 781.70]KAF1808158.1 hypothetical protein P152DRAFT_469152 [Eremomyces bilateralis CBS 781.70]